MVVHSKYCLQQPLSSKCGVTGTWVPLERRQRRNQLRREPRTVSWLCISGASLVMCHRITHVFPGCAHASYSVYLQCSFSAFFLILLSRAVLSCHFSVPASFLLSDLDQSHVKQILCHCITLLLQNKHLYYV